MALTLEQYAEYLDTRPDLGWPASPEMQPANARPHLKSLPQVKAVAWNVYGTLLHLAGGELYFEHPDNFIMDLVLDKTVQEFKMWKAMTRRPGRPGDYMRILYGNALTELRMKPSADKNPEILVEKAWEQIVKKLMTNEYVFDTGFYGSLDDYSRKIAYFFHASLQGVQAYSGAAKVLKYVHRRLGVQSLVADGQCFSNIQLRRAMVKQSASARLDEWLPAELRIWSHEVKARKPSERPFQELLRRLELRGIAPEQTLYVGSHVHRDIAPAKRLGMRTAFFAGDKTATQATKSDLKQPETRPDVLLTELRQIAEVVT